MDCLVSVGTSIAAKIAEYTVAPVGRQLGYIFLYRRNEDNLKTETQDMKYKMSTMKLKVEEARNGGEEIFNDVNDCLIKLDKIYKDAETLLGNTDIKCGLRGCFSYLVARYRLSKRAKEMRESVVEIKGEIRFENISFYPKLHSNFENKDYLTSVTREEFMDKIMEALGDGNVRTIGLHGMAGAGKTTLVKEIARKALANDRRLFDDAVIVTVSQIPDLEKIQQHIAERLHLELRKKIISERALELKNRLKYENNFLIILDDLGKKLNLEEVGIAFEGDHQKGFKILMTSRSEGLLGTEMEVDKNFKVELLSEDEALNWFSAIVGGAFKTREIEELATKIVKKCGRLPLAIATVGHSLKNRGLPLWRDAWTRLENSMQNETVSSAIKLCYDILESETKKLVLLCSLHEEDANIDFEYLMRVCWGMGMFKGNMTFQNARDRVYGWVNTLKDSCLLLNGDPPDTVKMHDVVRDIAISIAKESHDNDMQYCFRNGGEVEEFLKEKKFEDLKAISLPNGYLDELVSERSEYTHLQLMRCTWSKSSKTIPAGFLDRTKQLRVLDFSTQSFDSAKELIASHLLTLQNLRTLRLPDSNVVDIAEIGKLKNLEILDLHRSKINKLPGEIGQLTRLRILDLSCSGIGEIEPNVILQLKRLEELNVDEFENWHKVGVEDKGERRNAGLDELKHLVHLTALDLFVPDIGMLPEVLLGQKLERFKIIIGVHKLDSHPAFQQISSASRYLQILSREGSLLRNHGLEMLLKRSQVLLLNGLNGVNNFVYELDTEGFPELMYLELKCNNTIQYLANYFIMESSIYPCTVFRSLETLILHYLENLEEICNGEVTPGSFKTLRVVRIHECNSLKKLLPLFVATQLEEIEIVDCKEMEEIFTLQIQDGDINNNQVIEEFQLRSLKLTKVSKLREFCSKILTKTIGEEPFVGDSTMPLFNGKFLCFAKLEELELSGCDVKKLMDDQLLPSSTSFRRLTKLDISNCQFLKYVFSSSTAASFEQLSTLVINTCSSVEEIMMRNERMDKISFPKLLVLTLENLPNAETFSSEIFIQFPLLISLSIKGCPEFKTFVSSSSQGKSCTTIPSLFNEMVAFPNLKNVSIGDIDRLKMTWQRELNTNTDSFCKLEVVKVENCKNLQKIFPLSGMPRIIFHNLKELEISNCEMLEEIFEIHTTNYEETNEKCRIEELVFPQLEVMKLRSLPNLLSFCARPHTSRYPFLKRLKVEDCMKVKVLFASELFNLQRMHGSILHGDIPIQQPLFLMDKVAFPSLMSIKIKGMDMLKMIWQYEPCIIGSASFCKLEEVQVTHCKNLMGIFPSNLNCVRSKDPRGTFTFPNLKCFDASDCPNLKAIFPSSVAKGLFRLEVLYIQNCGIEEIVSKEEGKETVLHPDDDEFAFPQLKRMELIDLPNLVCFYAGPHTSRFPLLNRLEVKDCSKVKTFSGSELLSFQGMHGSLFSTKATFGGDEECEIKLCKLPNLMHLMEEEEESSQQPQTHLLFQHLTGLEVFRCGMLKKLVPSSTSFQNLKVLVVSHCDEMIHLLSSQTAKSMTQLTYMIIRKCKRMEEIITDAGVNLKAGDEIVFTQLKSLALDDLPSLSSFYSGNCKMGFPNLEGVVVTRCFGMQSFSKHSTISTPKLKIVSTKRIVDYGELELESESEPEPLDCESESESETESSSNRMIDINTIIAND